MDSTITGRAIIISNGRCGSTLLSDLIAEQADTLSAQEFFMSVAPWAKRDDMITGAEYWNVLSSPKSELATLFRVGLPPKEIRYPRTGRFAENMLELPRILAITLSKVSPDPDALFDELARQVPTHPYQSVGAHHQMFLDLLATVTGKRQWVERSGGSSHIAPYLLSTFPTAKFVYLTRSRDDIAKSMSKHSSFQLIQLRVESLGLYGVDPFRLVPGAPVPEALRPYLPDQITAELMRERGQDLRRFQGLSAFLTSLAEQALTDNRPAELLMMKYEDLVADPVGQLGELGRFLGFGDWEDWAARVAGRVVAPTSRPAPVPA